MLKLEFEINDDIFSGIEKIRNANDNEIDIVIPEGAVLLENKLNLKLLNKEAEKIEKTLHFQTTDEAGQSLIALIQEDEGINVFEGYSKQNTEQKETTPILVNVNKRGYVFKNMTRSILSKMNSNNTTVVNKRPSIKKIIGGIVVVLILIIVITKITQLPRAEISIVVNSQPFAKSVQIRVDKAAFTNSDTKTLRGLPVSTTIAETLTEDTTGQKVVGKKATGKAIIYNRTDTENTFKKGTTLIFTKDKKDYSFVTADEITISPAALQDPADPASAMIPGSKEVTINATDIGTTYNIDKDETLSVKGEKSSQFTAKTSTATTGGTSDTVKIVSQADKDKLTIDITKVVTDKIQNSLSTQVSGSQKFIEGSAGITSVNTQFDHQVNDEAEKLNVTATANVSGLVFSQSELETLINKLSEGFIPEGYVLSEKEKTITTSVLGNSENTVLNSDKADLQVTLKAYVVPNISEDSLKEQLKGKSPQDAEKLLSEISNVKTYSLNIKPAIPLFKNVPNDISRINIDIQRN